MKGVLSLFGAVLLFSACNKYVENKDYKNTAFTFLLGDTASTTAAANSYIKLILVKTLETDKDLKVSFSSPAGKLQGDEVFFQGDTAITYLLLGAEPAEYYLTAQVKDGSTVIAEKTLMYTSHKALPDSYKFEIFDTANVRADGVSVIKLQVTCPSGSSSDMKTTFTSTRGAIKLSDVTFENDRAISYLQVDKVPGNYYLTTQVKSGSNIIIEKHLIYTTNPAYPSSALLEVNKSNFNLTDEIAIKTKLLNSKNLANISQGLHVRFDAYQVNPSSGATTSVGRFQDALNVLTDDSGNVPGVTFVPDADIDSTKTLYISATADGANGIPVKGTLSLKYK